MKAFQFWYKFDENTPTEYIYIIAVSLKQAQYFYKRLGYTRMFDYSLVPTRVIDKSAFNFIHAIGDVLGQDAII